MYVIYEGSDDEQVRWGSNDDPRGVLTEGDMYKVKYTEPHTWHTKYILYAFPNLRFNSVCFREVNI